MLCIIWEDGFKVLIPNVPVDRKDEIVSAYGAERPVRIRAAYFVDR